MALNLTKEQLKQYDGKNGNKAYVAIDGTIYDVTDVDAWKDGAHHGHTAGKDLSDAIMTAPHKKSVLAKLPVVGKLV
ncbi:cytochrome b5 domain-containing protein [Secundilactobacillus folii]|uniref:Cytochrome B5 n=1 Tax=Secundilactobacillus folii TaxID=2678357 RepID=A0A7X2XV79_9LACO|nr:cytochrome b5 domain-containing protein [Secundilactobacillus folii]MTV82297.1 cytochrome B5 [Secundilactobacillus folii]